MLDVSTRNALSAAFCAVAVATGFGVPGLVSAVLSAALILLGMPVFRSYAMARPNARSSHTIPVPQGGGAAVIAAALVIASILLISGHPGDAGGMRFAWIAVGAILLAVIGAADDIRNLPVLPRLTGQMIAVACVVLGARSQGQILPVPAAAETVLLVVAGAWFVNLTNFMDGIDGITLAGFMPLAAGAATLAALGHMTPAGGLLAVCFLGALAGFVFFNWHPARLFLGDVGSLPVGLIGGALLLDLAQNGAMAAAIILPLYHFSDATLTLLRRLWRREKVWVAHRQHAYQNAVDSGLSATQVSGMILALNTVLAALAVLSFGTSGPVQIAAVLLACGCVISLIVWFKSRRPAP